MKVKDAAGTEILDLAGGNITLGGALGTLTAAQTGALTPAKHLRYDLELVSPGGVVTRLLEGLVGVSKQVTD